MFQDDIPQTHFLDDNFFWFGFDGDGHFILTFAAIMCTDLSVPAAMFSGRKLEQLADVGGCLLRHDVCEFRTDQVFFAAYSELVVAVKGEVVVSAVFVESSAVVETDAFLPFFALP